MSNPPNNFVWYELMTTDIAAAEAYYRDVVGWHMQDSGMPGMSYTLISAGQTQVGGMMALPAEACAAGARPSWSGYIAVDDVDAFAVRITQAGGSIHRGPEDIPGIGRFAVVADLYGASFVLFKGASDAQLQPPPFGTPGFIDWRELHAGDLDGAFAFYSALFGWTKAEAIDMGPMGVYQTFAAEKPIGGMMTKTAATPVPFWLFYFNVDDIEAAAARVTEYGGQIINGPEKVPGGSWVLQCFDPQGAVFALVKMNLDR